jgi:hypothetical protein
VHQSVEQCIGIRTERPYHRVSCIFPTFIENCEPAIGVAPLKGQPVRPVVFDGLEATTDGLNSPQMRHRPRQRSISGGIGTDSRTFSSMKGAHQPKQPRSTVPVRATQQHCRLLLSTGSQRNLQELQLARPLWVGLTAAFSRTGCGAGWLRRIEAECDAEIGRQTAEHQVAWGIRK